jgi:hypothetical protein
MASLAGNPDIRKDRVFLASRIIIINPIMKKTWSRKKINDEFTSMLKADGTPMSRQQIHMLRKRARGICMICSEPAVGVYCLKHTIAVRERMRRKLKYQRRLLKASSYAAQARARVKTPRSKARARKA